MKRNNYQRLIVLIVCFSCFQLSLNAQQASIRHIPDSIVNSYKNDKGYEYANDPAYWKKPAKSPDNSWKFLDKLFNPVLWKLVGYSFLFFLFLFIIYRLYVNGVFYRKESLPSKAAALTDDVTRLSESDLRSLLTELLNEGKYREAIRAQYLLTLLSLDRSGLIKLDANSTNHDYSEQLREHRSHSAFSFLLRMYEYAWYGEVKISEQDYAFAERRFQDFKKQF